MSNHPKMVNTKKAGGSDLNHLKAVNSNGKVILTVCMHVRYVRTSKSMRGCLSAFLSPWGDLVYFFL